VISGFQTQSAQSTRGGKPVAGHGDPQNLIRLGVYGVMGQSRKKKNRKPP